MSEDARLEGVAGNARAGLIPPPAHEDATVPRYLDAAVSALMRSLGGTGRT
jgi:hypothetical protein